MLIFVCFIQIQFLAIIVHLVVGMSTTCDFPFVLNCYIIIYCVTLIALFTNFYIEAYQHQRTDRLEIQAALQEKRSRIAAGGTSNNSYMTKLQAETVKNGLVPTASQNTPAISNGPKAANDTCRYINGGEQPPCLDINGNGPVPYLRRWAAWLLG